MQPSLVINVADLPAVHGRFDAAQGDPSKDAGGDGHGDAGGDGLNMPESE
ncbi:hypothetical protein V5P93_000456 [Actinokineospora auranticolor]|uniref:Uncharacterized protein n=1 Tax=Actinokineospora auranticolor TaxID=155976 RepID=A0A2S6GE56_9PSEU|nr:hypothetical protein [Actinokineospora auranticolor]PPK63490.1 hypothetical protein CLV40_12717 [Actinokineospora auranticolor]